MKFNTSSTKIEASDEEAMKVITALKQIVNNVKTENIIFFGQSVEKDPKIAEMAITFLKNGG